MNYIKCYENYKKDKDNDINLVLEPSGENIRLTQYDFDTLSDYVLLEYNNTNGVYIIDDDLKDVIVMVLNHKK